MNESGYKRKVTSDLKARGFSIQYHEDSYENFIPDISFGAHGIDGWVEVKWLTEFPKTIDHIKHYTMGQQQWLMNRGKAGSGMCYLLIGHPEIHMLWGWKSLADIRHIPWDAACMASDRMSGTVPGICAALDAVVRTRAGG